MCMTFHTNAHDLASEFLSEQGRITYVTPTSYLELINTFKKLLGAQRNDVMERKLRYDNGLEKILSTEAQVDGMQTELVALQPKLKQATIETDALLDKIAVDTKDANEVEAAGNSPLFNAAYDNWVEGIDLLVSLGAKVNASNNAGDTPYRWAENMHNEEAMEAPARSRASITVHTTSK